MIRDFHHERDISEVSNKILSVILIHNVHFYQNIVSVKRGVRKVDYTGRSRCHTMKHQRHPVYSGHHSLQHCRRQYKMSTTSYSSYSDTGALHSDPHIPTLIPDPLAPPTSIDSPPRYYSATLPPPRSVR